MKKILIGLIILVVVFVAAILVIGRTFYPDNIAETSIGGGGKNLKTRTYKTDFDSSIEIVRKIIPTLSTYGAKWKNVDFKDADSLTKAKIYAEVSVVVFTDDLQVEIKKIDEKSVQIDVRSQSRVGKSDFGENARHVRKLLNALDEKLGK